MKRIKQIVLALFVLSLVSCLAPAPAFAVSPIPNKYDRSFRNWTALYMPGRDWKLLKAQCWQESRFKDNAVSPVGAQGLCQFMPGTWRDVESQIKFKGSPFDSALNIQFAAYYMSRQRKFWSKVPVVLEMEKMAVASYNAGAGNIDKAWKLCERKPKWDKITPCLPSVTGRHSKETTDYVKRIWAYYGELVI
jgi:soluble lytic murein transglycosylase-like protein